MSSPRILVIAIGQALIKQVTGEAFDGKEPALRSQIGIRDPVIEGMAAAWRRELAERGAGGRLYTEGPGSALVVHAFRSYGDGLGRALPAIGGLRVLHLRRVADYIEAHLAEDIRLRDLAALASLSTHHFGVAFKTSTGKSPHRYLIERRIRRAKEVFVRRRTVDRRDWCCRWLRPPHPLHRCFSEADKPNVLPLSNGPELNCMTVGMSGASHLALGRAKKPRPGGLGRRLGEMLQWCCQQVAAGGWAQHHHIEHGGEVPKDYARFYFMSEAAAEAFRRRWCDAAQASGD